MYLNATGMSSMVGMMGGSPLSTLMGGGMGGYYDPRTAALTSIAQSLSSSSGGTDTEQALRQAMSRAFDDEARDLRQKLVRQ